MTGARITHEHTLHGTPEYFVTLRDEDGDLERLRLIFGNQHAMVHCWSHAAGWVELVTIRQRDDEPAVDAAVTIAAQILDMPGVAYDIGAHGLS